MEIITKINDMQQISSKYKVEGKRVAVVPTMGYLHQGHLSLIKLAKKSADIVITTLFVNPTQFAPNEDFDKYPRDFDRDSKLAESAGSDIIFAPNALEMYPIGFGASINIDKVTEKFEGEFRPHFFGGVATVVAKLFNATLPDIAVFGQKDYQQCVTIKKLVVDFNFPIEILIAPTMRESDGLAMSSRNTYLSKEERSSASILFATIEEAKVAIERGERDRKIINAILHKSLRSNPNLRIDYAAIANAENFDTPDFFLAGEKVVILLAVYIGKTRLIDNSVLTIPNSFELKNVEDNSNFELL